MISHIHKIQAHKARTSTKLIKLADNVAHWKVSYSDGSSKTIKHVWSVKQ